MRAAKKEKKLTKRAVDAFETQTNSRDRLWDTELKGFALLAYPTGRKVYVTAYRVKGNDRLRWFTIGKHGDPWTPETARDEARNVLAKAASGIDPAEEIADQKEQNQIKGTTVSMLIDRYLEEGPIDKPDKRESSWGNDRTYLNNHARPLLGSRLVSELTPDDMSKFQNDVLNGKSAELRKKKSGKGKQMRGGRGAASHSIRCLSAALGWAKKKQLIAANPCDDIEKIQDGKRFRYLSFDEAKRLFTAVSDLLESGKITQQAVDCITLISYTAARAGEIMALRWSEVDFERGVLILPPLRHKTGGVNDPKVLAMGTGTRTILERLRRDADTDEEFVFPSPRAKTGHLMTTRSAFDKITKEAELDDFRVHDFRHAYASFAINDGVDLKQIGANLGHKKQSTTERYAHLLVETRRPVTQGVEDIYKQAQNS